MIHRRDIDIYDHKTFSMEMVRLIDQHECTIRVHRDYKISKLCDEYNIITWFREDTPYNIICKLIEHLLGTEQITQDVYCKVNKNDPIKNPIMKIGESVLEISTDWILEALVVIAEMYNEMLNYQSVWPVVIHTVHDNSKNINQSIIHPGNNRWFVSQFPLLKDITVDLIEIDYTKKEMSNIFDYFEHLKYGIRVAEYYTEEKFDRKFEFFSPNNLSVAYSFNCLDDNIIELKNNKLIFNAIPLYSFDHKNKTLNIEKITRHDVERIAEPSYSYSRRDIIFEEHLQKIENGELTTMYYEEKEHMS